VVVNKKEYKEDLEKINEKVNKRKIYDKENEKSR